MHAGIGWLTMPTHWNPIVVDGAGKCGLRPNRPEAGVGRASLGSIVQ